MLEDGLEGTREWETTFNIATVHFTRPLVANPQQ